MSTQATRHFQKFRPISGGTKKFGSISGGNDGFKKIENLEFLKKSFQFRYSCEKTFSNNLVFEPMELSPLPPE